MCGASKCRVTGDSKYQGYQTAPVQDKPTTQAKTGDMPSSVQSARYVVAEPLLCWTWDPEPALEMIDMFMW